MVESPEGPRLKGYVEKVVLGMEMEMVMDGTLMV
jgi:hypothetical protein